MTTSTPPAHSVTVSTATPFSAVCICGWYVITRSEGDAREAADWHVSADNPKNEDRAGIWAQGFDAGKATMAPNPSNASDPRFQNPYR